jgi:putative ABC transport system substrate-binding protein
MAGELQGKRLELLKEIVPKMSRVAHLWNPENPATIRASKELEVATASLGIVLHSEEVRRADEIVTAFSSMARGRVDALLVTADPLTISNRKRIADLAAQHRLPSMYYMRDYVEDGGLISYGPSLAHQYRRVAGYVDRILKGAKPNELPVEQPNKFELVVNLRTAKVLGVRIPETVLARADEIIR